MFSLLLLTFIFVAKADFGCDTGLFFEPRMNDIALGKFYNQTKGPTDWPKQFIRRWDAPDPCAWDGNEGLHQAPWGCRCVVNGAWHKAPPHGDGGMMFIDVAHGYAEGPVPEEFKAFQIADYIGLSGNKLNGPLWNTSFHCFLHRLDVSKNRFSGTLHPDFMMRATLHAEIINLGYNEFEGPLPTVINTFQALSALLVNNNKFSGEIPDYSQATNLRHLDLSNNQFTGNFKWLRVMPNLAWIVLDNNKFSGELPELGPVVSHFSASGAGFTGKIPVSYGNLGYLHVFNCTGCNLECPTPDLLQHVYFSTHCKTNANPLDYQ